VETWDAIRARRNVRSYDDRPISAADLERILEAGRRSPSSNNQQEWGFVVVTDRELLRALAEVWKYAQHVSRSAATVALIAEAATDPDDREVIQYDLGQATMSMMLAAADLGIGSGHAAVGDQELARKILGFPNDRRCEWLIAFGYPADRPLSPIANPNRRPIEDLVHRVRW
jgi:nitroreductase